MNTINELLNTQHLDIKILLNDYKIEIENHFKKLTDEIEILNKNIKDKDEKILKLSDELKDNNFDKQNYQKFSMVSNFSKQIREKELEIQKKDLELKTSNSKLILAKKEIDALKEKLELISEKDEIEDLPQTKSNVQLYIEEQSKIIEEPISNPIQEDKKEKEKEKTKPTGKRKEEVVEEEEVEEEEEVSYIRKKIKGKYYFVSDEKPPQIYEYLENNEVGKLLGKMNENKAEFF